jgi:hypothetical protein
LCVCVCAFVPFCYLGFAFACALNRVYSARVKQGLFCAGGPWWSAAPTQPRVKQGLLCAR